MKISIITPCLNRKKFIPGLINSIKAQKYQNYEHIVIDGGSNDGTLSLLEEYQREDARVIVLSEKDKGMYFAINKGLKIATGDILCYLNTDDRFFPWTLEIVSNIFQKQMLHPTLIYGDTFHLDYKRPLKRFYPCIYPIINLNYLLNFSYIGQPAVFWNKCLSNYNNVFNTNFYLIADHEYWIRALHIPQIRCKKINEFLAIELNHPNTLREQYTKLLQLEKGVISNMYSCDHEKISKIGFYSKRLLQLFFLLRIIFGLGKKKWNNTFNDFDIEIKFIKNDLQKLEYQYHIKNRHSLYHSIL